MIRILFTISLQSPENCDMITLVSHLYGIEKFLKIYRNGDIFMKNICKRSFSLLLILSLLIALFAGFTSVSAATSYNDGEFGVVCTSPSSQASSYYTGSYTYATLSSQTGSSLKSSISSLVNSDRRKVGYDGLKTYFARTDAVNGSSSTFRLFYCGVQTDSSWDSADTWNREHMWPDSKGGSTCEGDLHSMRPTDPSLNSTRGNLPYGNANGGSAKYSNSANGNVLGGYLGNSVFEPLDNVKGDVARTILYDYCTYSSLSNLSLVFTSTDVLLDWIALDPVDEFEMCRNDVVQDIQGCRNPFVDYPDLAWRVFGKSVPADLTTPSGGAAASYTVTATSNNSSYGTVSVSGNVITASPKTGYYAAGYTVVSGSATVSQNGNLFTVTATSDCTVRINFAAKTALSIKFSQNGSVVSTQSVYAGDSINLPAHSGSVPAGYNFLGWVTTAVTDSASKPTVYAAGSSYTPNASGTLFALYSYSAEGSSGSGDYVKVTSAPSDWSGEYLIVYESGNLVFDSSLNSLDAVSNYQTVTISNNTISASDGDPYQFIITSVSGGYSIQGSNGSYIGKSSNNNGLDTGTSKAVNTLSMNGDGTVNIIGSGGAYLRFNSSSDQMRFRYYKSSSYTNQKAICLYVKDGSAGTVYYTTTTGVPCSHEDTSTNTVDPTCNTPGLTTVTCNDCGAIVDTVEIAALGHSYGKWISDNAGKHSQTCTRCNAVVTAACSYTEAVTPPTESEGGYTTYTCTECSYSYVGNHTPALGSPLSVSFSVPAGVTAPASQSAYAGSSISLPIPENLPSGEYEYSFVGWAEQPVDNATDCPTIYDTSYTVNATTTLYAVYTYTVNGTGSSDYVLTDIAKIQETDSVVITMTYTDGTVYALNSSNGSSKSPVATTVLVSGNKLTATPDTALLWSVGGDASGYIFYPEGSTSTWLYCTNSNSGVRVGTNTNKTFVIDASTGYLKHLGTGRYLGVYRTNPDWRCYTPLHDNIANQTLGFYVKGQEGMSYYTTVIGTNCDHTNTTTDIVVPTCQESGTETVTCDDCGEVLSTAVIDALGHDMIYSDNEDGTHTYGCSRECEVEDVIEDHVYVDGTCACGVPETVEPTELELKFYHSMSFDADLKINYRFAFDEIEAVIPNYVLEGAYLEIEKDRYSSSGEKTVEKDTITYTVDDAANRLVFSVVGIQSVEMGSELRAVLHIFDSEGKEYVTQVDTYSVLTYVTNNLARNDGKNNEFCTLLVDALNYGAAAQIFFDRRTDELVNAGIDAYQHYATQSLREELAASKETVTTQREITAVSKMNFSMSFDEMTKMNVKLTLTGDYTESDITAVKVFRADGTLVETFTDFELLEDGRLQVTFTGVKSIMMRDMFYFEAYVGEQLASDRYGYSMEAYAKSNVNSTNTEFGDMVLKCMYYGDSAASYFQGN